MQDGSHAAGGNGARGVLVAGARGSGKTSLIMAHARSLLDAGVPAWRILVVTFSPRVASRIAAQLPAEADAESAGGVWLQTAQRLCVRLLHECYRIRGQGEDVRILSAFERATLLHAAARRVAAELGPGHPLAPALGDTGGGVIPNGPSRARPDAILDDRCGAPDSTIRAALFCFVHDSVS